MKNYILCLYVSLFAMVANAQIIKDKFPRLLCSKALPLQQIGGPQVVLDPLLVYQVCINPKASDNKNPAVAKHLVGLVKVTNNSKRVYTLMVYYFWKGNQVNTKVVAIQPAGMKIYDFNLTAKAGKENENPSVEVRSENTKKILKLK